MQEKYHTALVTAANQQASAEPSDELRLALNALREPAERNREDVVSSVAELLPGITSPEGSGLVAIWIGAAVENDGRAEPYLSPILKTFLFWSNTVETAPDGSDEADPTPDPHVIQGLDYIGQALVACLARIPRESSAFMDALAHRDEIERVSNLTLGGAWVAHLYDQHSDDLLVINVAEKLAVEVRYENVANCFHLFSLLQVTLAELMPDARKPKRGLAEVVRGHDQSRRISDEAWWHYGDASSTEPDIMSSVWGEASPSTITKVDGVQVILLWPPILSGRSWDASFFEPFLDAALPDLTIARVINDDEIQNWWGRLSLSDNVQRDTFHKPWWKFW